VLNSLQTALFLFASDFGTVQAAIAWNTGSLTDVDWQQVRAVLPPTLLVLPGAVLGARYLNVLLLLGGRRER
jgi:iron complex transport system permease protein